jgi:hypothetical protein
MERAIKGLKRHNLFARTNPAPFKYLCNLKSQIHWVVKYKKGAGLVRLVKTGVRLMEDV